VVELVGRTLHPSAQDYPTRAAGSARRSARLALRDLVEQALRAVQWAYEMITRT